MLCNNALYCFSSVSLVARDGQHHIYEGVDIATVHGVQCAVLVSILQYRTVWIQAMSFTKCECWEKCVGGV